MNRTRILPALLTVLCTACGNGDDAERQQDVPASRTSSPDISSSSQVEGEMAEVADYRLSMDAVERWHEAQRNVYRQAESNPELVQYLDVDLDDPSLDDLEDHYASIPEANDAIEDAGLEVREFVLITFALYQATTAQQLIAMGLEQDSVVDELNLHPADLEFARQNRTRLEQLQRETDALAPAGLGNDDEDY